jgi:hypothetical protein
MKLPDLRDWMKLRIRCSELRKIIADKARNMTKRLDCRWMRFHVGLGVGWSLNTDESMENRRFSMRFNWVLIEIGWRFLEEFCEGFEVRVCFDIWSQQTRPIFWLRSLPMTNLPLAFSPLTLAALLHFPLISILNLPNHHFERHSPDICLPISKFWLNCGQRSPARPTRKSTRNHQFSEKLITQAIIQTVCCAVPTTRVEPLEPAAHQKPTNHRFLCEKKLGRNAKIIFNNSQVGVVTINFHLRCEHYEELCLLLFRDAAPTPSRWLSAKAVNLFTCFTASVTLVRFS